VAAGEEAPLRRVLVIGASGQVGGALREAFGASHVIGTYSAVRPPTCSVMSCHAM
jgi:dTDP-4-dehydrorhamnose reductase